LPSTVYATVVLSLATDLITFLGTKFGIVPLTNDLFLAAIGNVVRVEKECDARRQA